MDTEKENGLKGQEGLITLSMMQLGCRWIYSVDQEKGLQYLQRNVANPVNVTFQRRSTHYLYLLSLGNST
jgi:hypothetical protein